MKQTHPNDIVEVTKYDTNIPDERFFFFFFFCGKVRYGSSSGQERKYLLEKFVCMPRIHFSKRATAVNKKDHGKRANVFKAILEWQIGSKVIKKNSKMTAREKLLVLLYF